MSFFSSGLLALSMSTDAFAVSLGKGTRINNSNFFDAIRIGAVFGIVEAATPILGFAVGLYSSGLVREIDHWVAFFILFAVGIKFIHESFSRKQICMALKDRSIWILILIALATSIDAFAVGISLAFTSYSILATAISIGIATFTMVTIGIMTGHLVSKSVGVYAERAGGFLLILIGTKILMEHLDFI